MCDGKFDNLTVTKLEIENNGDIHWGNRSWLNADQGGSIELGGDGKAPGTGTPYIDFHYVGKVEDYNTRIINDGDGQLSVVAKTLSVVGVLAPRTIELGDKAAPTPYIDFHYQGNVEDYNTRIINDGDGQLSVVAKTLSVVGVLAPRTIELGDKAAPTPYIDFHYQGKMDDYNTRIINDGDGQLSVVAKTLSVSGDIRADGDVFLTGADCAEEFDVASEELVEPGTVMVIDKQGALRPGEQGYDKRVAGVISGAGEFRPGITLDKRNGETNRLPLALTGKVYCKVDAQYGSIEVGDLLTTSPTFGYAMKASDSSKAPGAVLGKALQELAGGQGLIPVLVTLQ